MNQRFLFIGAPGAGKTTTLHLLEGLGYAAVPDVARAIIQQRLSIGLPPRPSPAEFARACLDASIAHYDACPDNGKPIFFDRGIADTLGMLIDSGAVEITDVKRHLAERPYNRKVFLFPAWEAIYEQDSERDQTFADAVLVADRSRLWYEALGFTVLPVPLDTPEERAAFVLDSINALTLHGDHEVK